MGLAQFLTSLVTLGYANQNFLETTSTTSGSFDLKLTDYNGSYVTELFIGTPG